MTIPADNKTDFEVKYIRNSSHNDNKSGLPYCLIFFCEDEKLNSANVPLFKRIN